MFLQSAAQLRQLLARSPVWICDTETDGLQVIGPQSRDLAWIVGLMPAGTSSAFYIDCSHPEWPEMLTVLEDTALVGHNLRFDIHAMNAHPRRAWRDTMAAQYHLNTAGPKSLDDLFPRSKVATLPELKGAKGAKNSIHKLRRGLNDWDPRLLDYLADDLRKTAELHERFERLGQYVALDEGVERVVQRMEDRGVRLLADRLAELGARIRPLVAASEQVIRDRGFYGNLNSPKQLAEFLEPIYPQFRRSVWDKKKRERVIKFSTDTKTTLAPYVSATGDPLIEALMMWRSWMKKEKDFCQKLPTFVQPNGLIHGQVKTTRTGTLRMAHADPNMGQIPKRGKNALEREIGKAFRACFTGEGYYVSGADYSQFELRAIAALSGDERLLQAFAEGADPHALTASEMFGRTITKEDPERSDAKEITLGLPNGMRYKRLAISLGRTPDEALKFLERHRAAHPRLHEWMDEVNREAEQTRVATAIDGSVRVFGPDDLITAAVSMKMQGTAALLLRHALIGCEEAGLRPILTVHDEIVGDVKGKGQEYAEVMRDSANNAFPELLSAVDFVAEGGDGETWAAV